MRKLKVYGWQGYRSKQTREICAASSMRRIAEIVGVKRPSQLFNLCETRNDKELAVALRKPETVFWCNLDDSYHSNSQFKEQTSEI